MTFRETVALEALKLLMSDRDLRLTVKGMVTARKRAVPAVLANTAFDIADEMWKESLRPHRVSDRPKDVEHYDNQGYVLRVGGLNYIDRLGSLTADRAAAYQFSRSGAELYAGENDARFPGLELIVERA